MPAGARRGGVEEQIGAVTLEEARERLKFYKPGNAILSIAGVVEPGKTRELVESIFGDLPRGEPAPPVRKPAEVELGRVTTVPILGPGEPASVVHGFSVPAPGEEGFEAVAVIVSRLQRSMTDPAATNRVPPVFHPALDDPNLLLVTALLKADETPEAAAARVDALVKQACEAEVDDADRARMRQALGPFLGLMSLPPEATGNLYGVAFSIGRREQLGFDPAKVGERLDRLTAADLKRVYEEVLAPAKRSSVVLTPKAGE
jgi:zinc protease